MAVRKGLFQTAKVQDRIAVDALLAELDLGEAEAIVLAREANVGRILLDDRAARNRAALMGLSVTGTIGVLLLARRSGFQTMEDYRRWCHENLPDWLGYGRV